MKNKLKQIIIQAKNEWCVIKPYDDLLGDGICEITNIIYKHWKEKLIQLDLTGQEVEDCLDYICNLYDELSDLDIDTFIGKYIKF